MVFEWLAENFMLLPGRAASLSYPFASLHEIFAFLNGFRENAILNNLLNGERDP